ncbi:MAG: carbohydrate-binding family 9-like protein, partial [Chloroflexi bacterium]|nr:carbohydrate-binding family 9-like protein [Chloroflexota bacterium]
GGQRSRVALSDDGLHFRARPEILGNPYLRAFRWRDSIYALTMPGLFYRSRDGLTGFERGPQLFTPDMRHSAVLVRDDVLYVFYSNAGDCPESILLATVDLTPAWECWQASEPVVVLRPECDYEGADCPLQPSQRGPINERVRQLRDPALYIEGGRLYLLYSVAGESGIALAEVDELQPIAGRRQPRPDERPTAFVRPEYVCMRASGPIVVDGRLDEPDWGKAVPVELRLADSGGRPRQRTVARLLWDDDHLYVGFYCEDTSIWGVTTRRDQDIYNQEVVEVFIDADRDDYGYVEIEVNPLNAVLDLFMLNRDGRRKGLWDWDSRGLRTAVLVDGDPTRRDSRDRSWTVEMAIPMADFATAPNLPPRPGDVWHMNLYRIDRGPEGDEYSAWSPPGLIDYHTPQRFGRLIFSEGW